MDLINTRDAAQRAGYSLGSFRNLMTEADFPDARCYGAFGLKYFAWSDIESWLRAHRADRYGA